MIDNEKVLARLLQYAYRAEYDEGEIIFHVLPEIPTRDDWEILMTMFKDNIVHMEMIEEMLEVLGYEPPELVSRKLPEVTDRNCALEFIAKFEQTAHNYYSYLLERVDFGKVEDSIKNTLKTLAEWERRHMEMIRRVLDNFKVRYKLL